MEKASIEIDYRERDLLRKWKEEDPSFVASSLVCGDVHMQDDVFEVRIERKTWEDLWHSIQDGRYREQRSRLEEWKNMEGKRKKIMYLIEGSQGEVSKSCERILHRLTFIYDILIYRTHDLEESVQYLRWMVEHFSEFSKGSRRRPLERVRQESVLEETLPRKRDIHTPLTLLALTFYGIPGISKTVAFELAEQYGSLASFLRRCEMEIDTILAELMEFPVSASRKLGRKRASHLLDMLGFPVP